MTFSRVSRLTVDVGKHAYMETCIGISKDRQDTFLPLNLRQHAHVQLVMRVLFETLHACNANVRVCQLAWFLSSSHVVSHKHTDTHTHMYETTQSLSAAWALCFPKSEKPADQYACVKSGLSFHKAMHTAFIKIATHSNRTSPLVLFPSSF
jgi:hypothetical protein